MRLNETDDLENALVSECLAEPESAAVVKLDACEQNAYWKRRLCVLWEAKSPEKARACFEDRSRIPEIVKHGAGG